MSSVDQTTNKNLIKENLDHLFVISSNITSLNSNDPRCLACRINHCFQVSFEVKSMIFLMLMYLIALFSVNTENLILNYLLNKKF